MEGKNKSADNEIKVKKSIFDFMEIKRPQNKLKHYNGIDNTNTLPRVSKNRNRETNKSLRITKKNWSNKNGIKKTVHNKNSICSGSSSGDGGNIADKDLNPIEIEKKVEEFGERLKRQRSKRLSETEIDYNETKYTKVEQVDLVQDISPIILQEEESVLYPECTTKLDNQVDNVCPIFPEIIISEDKNEESDDHEEIVHNLACDQDDDFGYNGFEDSSNDNFILEVYNDDERGLIIIFVDVKRKSVHLNDLASNNLKEEENCDILLHENEENNSIEVLKQYDSTEEDELNLRFSMISTDDDSIELRTPTKTNLLTTEQENILDSYGNIRISRFSNLLEESSTSSDALKKDKLTYIIEEMLSTEEQYVIGLEKVVNDYKPYIEKHVPPNLVGKSSYLFGNIEAIYRESSSFLTKIRMTPTLNGITNAILSSVSMFELYPKYSKNKPTADYYLREFDFLIKGRQKQLGDRLDLASYLLTPIQRLGKYILILQNIQKELKKLNESDPDLLQALEIVKKSMKKGNDSIAIDSIKNCPLNLLIQGSFLMREQFNIIKPKKIDAMVFLFEKIIIFTQKISKQLEEFAYFESICLNDLSIAPMENEPFTFHLWNYTKVKRGTPERYTYVLEARTPKIKSQWTQNIEQLLWRQLEDVRNLQRQKHDIESSVFIRETPKRCDSKNKKLKRSTSKFYVNENLLQN